MMSTNHYRFDDKLNFSNPVTESAGGDFAMNASEGIKSIYELSAIVVDEMKFISGLKNYTLNKNFLFNDDNGGAYHVKSLIKISYDYAIEVSSKILLQSKQIAHFQLQTLIEQMYVQFKELNRAGKYFEHVFQKAVIHLESQKRQATPDIRRNYLGSPLSQSPQFSGEQRNLARNNQPPAPTIQQFRIPSPQIQRNPYHFQPQYPVTPTFPQPKQSQASLGQVPMDPQLQSRQYVPNYVVQPPYSTSPVNYQPRAVQTQPQQPPIFQHDLHAASNQTAERLMPIPVRIMVVDERTLRVQQQSPSVTSTLSPMLPLLPSTNENSADNAPRPPISDNAQVKAIIQQPKAVAIGKLPEIIPQNDDDKEKKEKDGKAALTDDSKELTRSPKEAGEADCSLLPESLAKFNENSKRGSSNLVDNNPDEAAPAGKKLTMDERSGRSSADKGDEPKSQAPAKEVANPKEAIRIPSIPSLKSLLSAPVKPMTPVKLMTPVTNYKLVCRPLYSPVKKDSRDHKADLPKEMAKLKTEAENAKRDEGPVDLTDSDTEVELVIDTESEITIERKFVSSIHNPFCLANKIQS